MRFFFSHGDFFEMFFEDAEVASKILEITLTSRNKKDKKSIPVCIRFVRFRDIYQR